MDIKNKKKAERNLCIVMALSLLTLVLMSGYMAKAQGNGGYAAALAGAAGDTNLVIENQYGGIIRFHVIANSDSEADQALKLKVRNNVLAKVENHLADEFSLAADRYGEENIDRAVITREYISANLDQIKEWSEGAIKAEGSKYKAEVSLGVTYIPAKTYDDIYFPAGNYEALNIVIGEGQGQNWWCVIFPPLCLVDCSDSVYKDRFEAVGEDRIILKSKIRELLSERKAK